MQITGFHRIIPPAEFDASSSLGREKGQLFRNTTLKFSNSVPGKKQKSPQEAIPAGWANISG